MYSNILVPYAGSGAGDKALKHAIAMAKDYDAKITILHVVEDIPVPLSFEYPERMKIVNELDQIKDELKGEMQKQLDAMVTDLGKHKIKIDTVVVNGYPDEEIARIAADEKYDLIIMAKRRKLKGIMGVLRLGSTSRKILERVSSPLLLIDGESE